MKKSVLIVFAVILLIATFMQVSAEGFVFDTYGLPAGLSNANAPTPNVVVTTTTRNGTFLKYLKYTGSATPADGSTVAHPTAVKIGNSSNYYNCHSYALIYGGNMTGVPTSNLLWLNTAENLFENNTSCYYAKRNQVYPSNISTSLYNVGDIVIWHYSGNPNSLDFSQIGLPHSGIVSKIQSGTVYIKSKWGTGAIFEHALNDHPYATELLGPTRPYTTLEREISIYRRLHACDASINPATAKYAIHNSSYHYPLCAQCGRLKLNLEAHTFVTVGRITKCSKCGYTEDIPINKEEPVYE